MPADPKFCGRCGRPLQVLFHVERYCPHCECPPKPAPVDEWDQDTVELCPRCGSSDVEPFFVPGRPHLPQRCVPCGYVWR